MHIHHDHVCGGHCHEHEHEHDHHECGCHNHDHEHGHCHEHGHECHCQHTPMEELAALMKYMVSHNTSHANELAQLAQKLKEAGNNAAFEQVMAAVSDFEKGNMRLSVVLASLSSKLEVAPCAFLPCIKTP